MLSAATTGTTPHLAVSEQCRLCILLNKLICGETNILYLFLTLTHLLTSSAFGNGNQDSSDFKLNADTQLRAWLFALEIDVWKPVN